MLPHPSRLSLGTHKNLQPCRLPNLFSCQISSSELALIPASASVGCFKVSRLKVSRSLQPCDFETLKPLIQPNVRRQATFSNRDTDSVVVLTPNIGLVELTGIEPAASWLQTRRSPS